MVRSVLALALGQEDFGRDDRIHGSDSELPDLFLLRFDGFGFLEIDDPVDVVDAEEGELGAPEAGEEENLGRFPFGVSLDVIDVLAVDAVVALEGDGVARPAQRDALAADGRQEAVAEVPRVALGLPPLTGTKRGLIRNLGASIIEFMELNERIRQDTFDVEEVLRSIREVERGLAAVERLVDDLPQMFWNSPEEKIGFFSLCNFPFYQARNRYSLHEKDIPG